MATDFAALRLGILGVGNMGGAIVRGVLRAALLPPEAVTVCDPLQEKVRALQAEAGVQSVTTPADLAAAADLLLLAVKPQDARATLASLAPGVNTDRHCLVSIVAGVTTATLAAALPAGTRVVRVMPNTPALVGQGMTAVSPGAAATADDVAHVRQLFATVGKVVEVDETLMDAVTAVSGSGPAYVFHVAECLTAAAVAQGLADDVAAALVRQTLLGAATLLDQSPESAATLRERVTSPGGTTAAALAVLADRDFAGGWREAIAAATRRGAELAKLA